MQLRGVWYAVLSITWDVPEVESTSALTGDSIAWPLPSRVKVELYSLTELRALTVRQFQRLRMQLQKAGKYRAVKKLERRERRCEVNHTSLRWRLQTINIMLRPLDTGRGYEGHD